MIERVMVLRRIVPFLSPWLFFSLLASGSHLEGSLLEKDEAVRAVLKVHKKESWIGDPIPCEIEVEGPKGTKFQWPDLKVLLSDFSVSHIQHDLKEERDGRVRGRCLFELTLFKIGTFDIPAIPVTYRQDGKEGIIRTHPQQIVVQSVLKEGKEQLADIKGPIKIPWNPWPAVSWTLFGILVIGGILFLVIWMRKMKLKEKVIPAEDIFKGIPPHEWAYAELDKLLGKRLLERGLYKEFYIAFSEILKRYLEGRYRIETMEKTTHEIQGHMISAKVNSQLCREVLSILEDCDLVKFAKYVPSHDQSKKNIQQFYSLIDQTKPQEEKRPEEEIREFRS